ncbi:MAG: YwmB family TATA-box binding protein [Moorellales bacterium]
MALRERFRNWGAPALLAGALILLAASPPGKAKGPTGDELVWWALEQVGARPQAAALEAQLLLPAGEGREALTAVAERLGRGEESSQPEGEGDSAGRWRVCLRSLPEWAGSRSSALLVVQWHRQGRSLIPPWPEDWRGHEARVYRLYRARLPGTPPTPILNLKARRMAALLGGRVLEGTRQPGMVTLSGYSPLLGPGRRPPGGGALNFQLALRASREQNCTWVVVGLPLIPGSF